MDEDKRLRWWALSRIVFHEHPVRERRVPTSTDADTRVRAEVIALFQNSPFSPQGKPH
jgi:hypothetical protein